MDIKQSDISNSNIIYRLLDNYNKFEKRKRVRVPPYYQASNNRVPFLINKEDVMNPDFQNVMVFESLNLKQKLKYIFPKV